MSIIQKFTFFRCHYCGMWYYTNRPIKTKKCLKCNRSFQVQKSYKFSKKCTIEESIAILKELKKKMENEDLAKYTSKKYHLTIRKIK
ncbi:MAG: DUF1922 domain-containing protein [Promethearchaeota archaeon]|nr:MAG: DUF1922 domain-containing protein [Candidatus Lokiarchaeota archaeon]